jgi:hypothetical protein
MFHCVGGRWDRTQGPGQLRLRHWLSDVLTTRQILSTTRLDLIHNSARSHPHSARSHPLSARSHPHSDRSHHIYVCQVKIAVYAVTLMWNWGMKTGMVPYVVLVYGTYRYHRRICNHRTYWSVFLDPGVFAICPQNRDRSFFLMNSKTGYFLLMQKPYRVVLGIAQFFMTKVLNPENS